VALLVVPDESLRGAEAAAPPRPRPLPRPEAAPPRAGLVAVDLFPAPAGRPPRPRPPEPDAAEGLDGMFGQLRRKPSGIGG